MDTLRAVAIIRICVCVSYHVRAKSTLGTSHIQQGQFAVLTTKIIIKSGYTSAPRIILNSVEINQIF